MPESDSQRIEDFIFVRELYEVFLLLDHISGRWDKSLYAAAGVDDDGCPHIDELVAIGLAPATSDSDRVTQAVKLLCAKDKLNAAARPATGMTIAFTLLVASDEYSPDWKSWLRRLLHLDGGAAGAPAPAPLQQQNGEYWNHPTRLTLARYAFPGLVKSAARFKRRIFLIVLMLLAGLVMTCLISWHVAAGNMILQNMDELKLQSAAVVKQIGDAEMKFTDDRPRVVRFCASDTRTPDARPPVYHSTEEYQLCTRREHLAMQLRAARNNLRNWMQPWREVYSAVADRITAPVSDNDVEVQKRGTEQLARTVTMVAGTAVLPLCYGILGAGAAVVRGLWAKMRESLLSPREYTLALLQLALGATIGACIALFITPSGTVQANDTGLLGNWALSSSALSFIAGFGVEGVFLALESLVRRVFNIPETQIESH